jgi:DNA processing protein
MHKQKGIGITTYYDEDFPSMLRATINEDGKEDPPMILYYKGNINITNMPCIAVIGTREITDFGKQAGLFLTKLFALKGFCIVSGLAIGCDTIGHQGALAVGGKTIAFLAHGLDYVYPLENEGLAQEIVNNGGLLMSEYPIGIGVNRYNLVARDRLQAGMSLGTLVIQTGVNGGTMHAANTTLRAQKPLFTVKFQYQEQNEHEKSLGNALLVKKGAKYISGNDYDSALNYIETYQKPKTSLFE